LDHAFEVIKRTFWGNVLAAPGATPMSAPDLALSATADTPNGEVVITVARTDAPLDEVLQSIKSALGSR
jgi:hypothetical protein